MVGEPFLNVNCDHLRSFNTNLYRQLICYPQSIKTHIDVIHYRKTDSKRLHGVDDEETEQKMFAEERVEMLKELSRKPDIYERLSLALAPSIYEHEDIKKGMELLQSRLFCSCRYWSASRLGPSPASAADWSIPLHPLLPPSPHCPRFGNLKYGGILLQLFGGSRKDFSHTGRGSFRAEINLLLCGDPGTSKSQLLQYVCNLVP
ncbi:unnamed protein product [Lepidochelys kempii]